MPEGTLQLEHLMQATKLLQLKKATVQDIEITYDVSVDTLCVVEKCLANVFPCRSAGFV
jgi:hypothetical protein